MNYRFRGINSKIQLFHETGVSLCVSVCASPKYNQKYIVLFDRTDQRVKPRESLAVNVLTDTSRKLECVHKNHQLFQLYGAVR